MKLTHFRKNRTVAFLVTCLFSHAVCLAQQPQSRELSADRPDSTETPITVPAGRFQLETSLVSFTQDGHAESWVFAETNFKFGLTDNTDVQLVVAPYVYESESEDLGDIILRFKWNLWGNDSSDTSFGLLPWAKIPVQTEVSNNQWEGGLVVPFACDISERVNFGCQVEVANIYDESVGQYWTFGHTVVLGIALTEQLGLYLEYAGAASELPYEAFGSGGLTYLMHDDLQYDVGVLKGLNGDSSEFTFFTGLTVRY